MAVEADRARRARVEAIAELIAGGPEGDNLLQQVPVQADIWSSYAADPAQPLPLLLHPSGETAAGEVAARIRARLQGQTVVIASLQGLVAARLTFRQFAAAVIPELALWPQLMDVQRGRVARWQMDVLQAIDPAARVGPQRSAPTITGATSIRRVSADRKFDTPLSLGAPGEVTLSPGFPSLRTV